MNKEKLATILKYALPDVRFHNFPSILAVKIEEEYIFIKKREESVFNKDEALIVVSKYLDEQDYKRLMGTQVVIDVDVFNTAGKEQIELYRQELEKKKGEKEDDDFLEAVTAKLTAKLTARLEETFILTDNHIKLLSNSYVSWRDTDYGAACIDPKRPYGNSDVIADMYEIVTGQTLLEGFPLRNFIEYEVVIDSISDFYERIHRETETALQIILYTKKFETGVYKRIGYCNEWIKVQDFESCDILQ